MKIGRVKKKQYTKAPAATAKRRLRRTLFGFFLVLTIPILFLLDRVYTQQRNESVFQFRTQAEELTHRIDQCLLAVLDPEQQRPFAEYSFFNVLENPLLKSKGVKLSPLSEFPPGTAIPGLFGYFQINPDGSLHTPILPDTENPVKTNSHGLSGEELHHRVAFKTKLRQLLTTASNRVIATKDEEKREASMPRPNRAGEIQKNVMTELAESLSSLFPEEPATSTHFGSNKDALLEQPLDQPYDEQEPASSDRSDELGIDSTDKASASRPIKENQVYGQAKKVTRKQYANSFNKLQARTRSRKEKVQIPDQSAAQALFDQNYGLSSSTLDNPAAPEKNSTWISKVEDSIIANDIGNRVKILTFESEVDPLQVRLLGTAHFCFFRRVWQDNGCYIQGFIVAIDDFLQSTIQPIFQTSQMGQHSQLSIVFGNAELERMDTYKPGIRLADSRSDEKSDADRWMLHETLLAPPLNELKLVFGAQPGWYASGNPLLTDVLAGVLVSLLLAGAIGLYRLGCGQIDLAQRQSNFVSDVSHELKTPLTSIRMYGEMLRSGWVLDDDKRRTYYDFIFFESERLSRLIANVLQLSKLSHNHSSLELTPYQPSSLLQLIKTKTVSQIEASGFELNMIKPESDDHEFRLLVEEDAFSQIFINLVDNAVKFSSDKSRAVIDFGYRLDAENPRTIVFFVRDYGPGVE